ncbi:(S)-benzoin forming benzil reductase [Tuberibacillus sp. Marseille-P3662]|uniref:(S)-benzoin forming benzil reductase n=1 Tax=Tuberibacillus sp. Marseille-P3662 TaxID=1965358 RepID=UPI001594DC03|nr:(S)-benzoin forming benzil reductase [Tuberibacillus sp. Marseille-P3662]
MRLAIVTGASRGFGAAVAQQFLDQGFVLYTVARNENQTLKDYAKKQKADYTHFVCDLSSPEQQVQVLHELTASINGLKDLEEIYIINNAGVVEPIKPVGQAGPEELQRLININVLAPMTLTNGFVHEYPSVPLFVVNVSSGAAERPVHGWSGYGSSKAAINLYTQTAAVENEIGDASHRFIAFNPGVMDTDMQGVIRSTDQASFNDVERFKDLKANNRLRSPNVVADALMTLILGDQVESGRVYDVKELL